MRMFDVVAQVRVWLELILLIIAFVMAASASPTNARRWLLISLGIMCVARIGWAVYYVAQKFGVFSSDQAATFVPPTLLMLLDLTGVAAMIMFVMAWRSNRDASAISSP